jgi:hypothetical protein
MAVMPENLSRLPPRGMLVGRVQSSGSSIVLRTAGKARHGLTVAGLGEAGVWKKLRGHRPQLQ